MDAIKAASPAAFLDDMFESDAEKRALSDHIRQRRIVSMLTTLRVTKGLTQADIATVMGCKQARVSKLESGIDADLKISDLEAYAKATKSEVTLMISDRGKSLAEQIKAHAFSIRNAFLKLVALAKKDDMIARGVAEFHMQAFHNINSFLAETAEKLPVNAENGRPYIQIACVDDAAEKSHETPTPQRPAKQKKASPELVTGQA